ncbi:isocitrate lyase/PEP mutase family protein (plasmid) [Pseudohalocynthiibacter aestuariivivens]|nr:isocitrate lyase/PEP mutase family protein [Pseudohalocynthiibacter aestuariivivens]QIE48034.1 isocitrate lyase/PEP mutase family protein [Pseudohalocynthiibacter aestuariivivens]
MTKAAKLRKLLERGSPFMVPGIGSPLEARLAKRAGFEAVYISGYSMAASRFGLPDIGLVAFRELREMAEAVTDVVDLPIIADCDTGYGDVVNVRQVVQALERIGIAAIQIEDQKWPKRCGHMASKEVEPVDVAVAKIEAAIAARQCSDTLIIARTDSREIIGFDEAVMRARKFKEAGADLVIMHGPADLEEMKRFADLVGGPHLAAIGEGEASDTCTIDDLYKMGFSLIALPSSILRTYIAAVEKQLQTIVQTQKVDASVTITLDEANEVVGLDNFRKFEESVKPPS